MTVKSITNNSSENHPATRKSLKKQIVAFTNQYSCYLCPTCALEISK